MWKQRQDILCMFLPKDLVVYKILRYYPSYDREYYKKTYEQVLYQLKMIIPISTLESRIYSSMFLVIDFYSNKQHLFMQVAWKNTLWNESILRCINRYYERVYKRY